MEYKKELEGFPTEVVEKMLERQVEQRNQRDVTVFELAKRAGRGIKGFCWEETVEGHYFWERVILHKDFDVFFEKYPKPEKTLTFPREMLVWDNKNYKRVELVLGIIPERTSAYKIIGIENVWKFAEEITEEKPKDPLLEKLEELETELQTLKNEIKSRTAGQCKP